MLNDQSVDWSEMNRSKAHSGARPILLTTNMRIPRLREGLINRSSLLDKMDQALNFPLTLVSAPAGFGKSTLLSQWISSSQNENPQNRVAWVSLESDCDLHQFWTYILAALEEIQPGVGESALALLEPSQPPIQTILRILINEISQIAGDFILALDDYHQIDDPTIHTALTYFVNHLPPNLHLVVASRGQPPLPLARWRASNQLFELREDDLRFSLEEAATFFNEARGLNLSREDITALGTRTEGWIAGLQLVALSLQGFDELSRRSFISAFTGNQRYILDYLVEEVLQQQPEEVKSFLLRTSVLDRLSAPLCNAIMGKEDGQAMLDHLVRTQLLIIPLDQEQKWYRYHHLFRDVLQHRLTQVEPDFAFELHRRAAKWYIRAGRTDDAIRHACTARDWDQAIELIEKVISTAWNRGEIRKIIEWVGSLPREYQDSHPHLSLYYSRALLHGGQMEAAEQRLLEAEATLRASIVANPPNEEDKLLLGMVCAFRTTVAAVSNEPANALVLGREALILLPSEKMDIRAYVTNSLGVAHYFLGNMPEALQALSEGGELARSAGILRSMMVAASFQAEALVCQGQLRQAEQILQKALVQGAIPNQITQSWRPAASLICADFGNLLYEWNRLAEAEYYLAEAIELGHQHAFGRALWLAYYGLMRVRLAYGDKNGALETYKQAQHYQRLHSLPLPARLIEAVQARAQLTLGDLEAAESWAAATQPEWSALPGLVEEIEGIIQTRLHLIQKQPEQALALLGGLRQGAEANERNGHMIEILALTALAQHALGEAQQAIETLLLALRMAEPENYVRTFVDEGQPMAALLYQARVRGNMPDYISRLLSVFPAEEPNTSASLDGSGSKHAKQAEERLIEPLSQREIEVLQLVANGASNQDIAEGLVIAMTTAKKHVSNIFQKLGVNNRTQAVAKGRQLGLCE